MTMKFITIRDAITTTLGDAAAGRYRVLGYQENGRSAESVLDDERLVQVFYQSGSFPETASGLSGPFNHKMTFTFQFEVASRTEVDLTVLLNPASTAADVQAAWAALKPAEAAANEAMDELFDIVWNVVMDARERDFGLSDPIGSRWLNDFRKESVIPRGEYAVITAAAQLTCNETELVTGETPTAIEIIDTQIDIADDDVEKTGVIVDTT